MVKSVLLVEDEPNIIEAIRFILSRDGWSVSAHSDGKTALEAVIAKAPDVLILDAMLPGRSGFDILRNLRALAGVDADSQGAGQGSRTGDRIRSECFYDKTLFERRGSGDGQCACDGVVG